MNNQHIITTADVFTTEGHLHVAKGATGVVVNCLGDLTVVAFDMAQMTHVAPDANGQLNKMIPTKRAANLNVMPENEADQSPLAGDITFQTSGDRFEVGGRCDDGNTVYVPQDGEAPHFWSVYQRPADGGPAEWVADYESKGVAFAVAEHLSSTSLAA